MASLSISIGTHLSSTCHFKNYSLPQTQNSVPSRHCFGSSLCRTRGPRLLGNGVLARAEDKARGSTSSSSSSSQPQPNSENQLAVILVHSYYKIFTFLEYPFGGLSRLWVWMSDFGEVWCIELTGFGKVMKIWFLFCSFFRILPIYIVTVTLVLYLGSSIKFSHNHMAA